jgi:hypothetical protein
MRKEELPDCFVAWASRPCAYAQVAICTGETPVPRHTKRLSPILILLSVGCIGLRINYNSVTFVRYVNRREAYRFFP